jgi:hypothetical protein
MVIFGRIFFLSSWSAPKIPIENRKIIKAGEGETGSLFMKLYDHELLLRHWRSQGHFWAKLTKNDIFGQNSILSKNP